MIMTYMGMLFSWNYTSISLEITISQMSSFYRCIVNVYMYTFIYVWMCVCVYVMIYTHTCIWENERCNVSVNYFYNDVQYESNQL